MQFWHRLALKFGATVEELKERMSYRAFLRWQEWFDLHPFGDDWDDARMAVLSAKVVAALTGKKQEVKKHMATHGRPSTHKQSPKKQLMILKDFVARSQAWAQMRR